MKGIIAGLFVLALYGGCERATERSQNKVAKTGDSDENDIVQERPDGATYARAFDDAQKRITQSNAREELRVLEEKIAQEFADLEKRQTSP